MFLPPGPSRRVFARRDGRLRRLLAQRSFRLAAFAASAAAIAAFVLASSAASAPSDVRTKREQAELVLAQVHQLGEEVGAAAERWNGARLRLERLEGELRTTRRDLTRARSGYRVAERRAGERLVALYTGGQAPSTLEIVLGAQSLDDVVDALEAGRHIANQDGRIVAQLEAYRIRVAQRERRLQKARGEQTDTVAQLAREREAIEARLLERERLLATVQAEVRRLEAAERARQAELERRALAAVTRERRAAAEAATVEAPAASERPAAPPETAPPPPPADASRGAQAVAIAMRYLGVPYKWGGASPSTGFDCSGLTMYVFAQIGVSLPHYAAAQYGMGRAVSRSELAPGDLVFFRGLGHMGMYIGGGNFIHAPQTGDVVKISSLNEPYRIANWVGARRIL